MNFSHCKVLRFPQFLFSIKVKHVNSSTFPGFYLFFKATTVFQHFSRQQRYIIPALFKLLRTLVTQPGLHKWRGRATFRGGTFPIKNAADKSRQYDCTKHNKLPLAD